MADIYTKKLDKLIEEVNYFTKEMSKYRHDLVCL